MSFFEHREIFWHANEPAEQWASLETVMCLTGTYKLQGMEEQALWDYAAIKGEALKIDLEK